MRWVFCKHRNGTLQPTRAPHCSRRRQHRSASDRLCALWSLGNATSQKVDAAMPQSLPIPIISVLCHAAHVSPQTSRSCGRSDHRRARRGWRGRRKNFATQVLDSFLQEHRSTKRPSHRYTKARPVPEFSRGLASSERIEAVRQRILSRL